MALTQPPFFFSGETTGTAANLNAWMNYFLQQIGAIGVPTQMVGTSAGTSNASAFVNSLASANGISLGFSNAFARSGSLFATQTIGTAAGTSNVLAQYQTTAQSTGTAQGIAVAAGFGGGSAASPGTATGSSAALGVASLSVNFAPSASGTSAANGVTNQLMNAVGTASGTSTANGAFPTQTETADGFLLTLPTQTIFASTTPGAASSVFNQFSISANPGVVVVNGTQDNTTSGVVELYYHLHYVYAETSGQAWTRWMSAGNWTPVANPFPPTIVESPEGTVSNAGPIYGSSTVGSAAPAGATVGNGLVAFTIVNSQVYTQTTAAGPAQLETNTAAVTSLTYHNHQMWQFGNGNWYAWTAFNTYNVPGQAASPVATTPAIYIAQQQTENTNQTFVVNGTLTGYGTSATVVNLVRNSNPTNGSAAASGGSPGILPTNWSSALFGLTQTVVAVGQSDPTTGLPYIDINFTGSATGLPTISFDNSTAIPVSATSDYIFSFYMSISGGTGTNVIGGNCQADGFDANGNYDTLAPGTFASLTTTPTRVSVAIRTLSTTRSLLVFFSPSLAGTAGAYSAINCTFRFSGIQLQTGTTVSTWQSTPVSNAAPTLNYQDNNGTTVGAWTPFTSNVNVTPTSFSFVHPALSTVTNNQTISVRDANSTTVVGTSNPFQVATAGVVTLLPNGITTTPSTVTYTAGSPAGALATVKVAVSPGTFTGTISVSPSSAPFAVTSSGGVYTLGSTSVLSTGSYSLTLTATQIGAAGSGETYALTVTGVAESPAGTAIGPTNPTVGNIQASPTPGTAVTGGGAVNTITITSTGTIKVQQGATIFTGGANVTELYYIGHTCYQLNSGGFWFGPITITSTGTGVSSPIPLITVTTTTFQPVVASAPAEEIGNASEVTVVCGGSNNVITLSIAPADTGPDYSKYFSFSGTSSVQSFSGATAPLYTVAGTNIPANNYPIKIIATII